MSSDLPKAFGEAVTKTATSLDYPVGTRRYQNGKLYVVQQADDALTANHAVVLDPAASSTGKEVTGATAANQLVVGAAEVAVSDEAQFYMTAGGVASVLVADGVAVNDILAPSATAGVLDKWVPRQRQSLVFSFNNGGTLADGTTYKGWLLVPFACTVKAISLVAQQPTVGGTNTFKALKAASNGNTLLSAATYDPTALVANTVAAMTLTGTAADLSLTAAQAIYVEYVTGTQTTDAINVSVVVEVEPTSAVQIPCGVAMEANSSGDAAAKNVFLLHRA